MRAHPLTPEQELVAHGEYMRGATYAALVKRYKCSRDALLTAFRVLGLRGHGHVCGRGAGWLGRRSRDRYGLYIEWLMRR